MKRIIKEFIGSALYLLSICIVRNKLNVLSIYFHNPSSKLFLSIVKWLKRRDYEILSLDEYAKIINKSHKRKIAVLTIDDGWRGNLELIPIIDEYNIPITIFISTGPIIHGNFWWEYASIVDQYKVSGIKSKSDFKLLDITEFDLAISNLKRHYQVNRSALTIDELIIVSENKNITIGAHTVSHPILPNCDIKRINYELRESKKQLEAWCGSPIKYFSYPNGDIDEKVINMVSKVGFDMAFSTEAKYIKNSDIDCYSIPRFCINDDGGYWENISKVIGIWQKVF